MELAIHESVLANDEMPAEVAAATLNLDTARHAVASILKYEIVLVGFTNPVREKTGIAEALGYLPIHHQVGQALEVAELVELGLKLVLRGLGFWHRGQK